MNWIAIIFSQILTLIALIDAENEVDSEKRYSTLRFCTFWQLLLIFLITMDFLKGRAHFYPDCVLNLKYVWGIDYSAIFEKNISIYESFSYKPNIIITEDQISHFNHLIKITRKKIPSSLAICDIPTVYEELYEIIQYIRRIIVAMGA